MKHFQHASYWLAAIPAPFRIDLFLQSPAVLVPGVAFPYGCGSTAERNKRRWREDWADRDTSIAKLTAGRFVLATRPNRVALPPTGIDSGFSGEAWASNVPFRNR